MGNMTERIRILLVKCGNISEAELARKMDISPQNLHSKMKRNNFTEEELQKIATVLNCSYKAVFTLSSGEEV
jgi:DNA-binding Xre family transcriptional regulator